MIRVNNAQDGLPAVYMRGGTSKGLFFHEGDLPGAGPSRDALLLELMGSPDPLQIDGLGGGHSSSSKAIAVAESSRDDADIEYSFMQVGVDRAFVSHDGNCGNLTFAVAPFAIDEGLVSAGEETTTVRMWNINTGTVILAEVVTVGGFAAVNGKQNVAGIARAGSSVVTKYVSPAGALCGEIFPTGSPTDQWEVDGLGIVDVTIVDVVHPYMYVPASTFGLSGSESPTQMNQDAALLQGLERLRAMGTVALGFASSLDGAREVPAIPRIGIVASPQAFTATDGTTVGAEDSDILVRMASMGRVHHACPVTGLANLAAACLLPGTVTAECAVTPAPGEKLRIGHPKGVATSAAQLTWGDDGVDIASVSLRSTARRLMDGTVYHRGDGPST